MAGEKNSQTDANGWTPELLKQRRRRALIMALALAGLVGMFFSGHACPAWRKCCKSGSVK